MNSLCNRDILKRCNLYYKCNIKSTHFQRIKYFWASYFLRHIFYLYCIRHGISQHMFCITMSLLFQTSSPALIQCDKNLTKEQAQQEASVLQKWSPVNKILAFLSLYAPVGVGKSSSWNRMSISCCSDILINCQFCIGGFLFSLSNKRTMLSTLDYGLFKICISCSFRR